MKVELLETVHETWLPKGTIGELIIEGNYPLQILRFIPDVISKDYGFNPEGAYIGVIKYKII